MLFVLEVQSLVWNWLQHLGEVDVRLFLKCKIEFLTMKIQLLPWQMELFYLCIYLIDSNILSSNSSQFLMFQSGWYILGNQALALVIMYLACMVVIAMSFQGHFVCSYFCKKCYFNNVNFGLNDCASIKSHILINPLLCS